MNEPKFRGFSKENDSWFYGFGWFLDGLSDDYKQERNIEDFAVLLTENGAVECVLSSMGQYIEMKDINMKEAYIGDIIFHTYLNYEGEGNVEEYTRMVILKDIKQLPFQFDDEESIEIVGNTYGDSRYLTEASLNEAN